MEETPDRAAGVVARATGNTVSAIAAALLTHASIALGKPELAQWIGTPTASLIGATTEELVMIARSAWQDRSRRIDDFADAVADAAGMPAGEFIATMASHRAGQQLLSEAVDAAANTHDDWKIRTLGMAFVYGANDPAKIDEARLLLPLLDGIETVHARALAAIYFQSWHYVQLSLGAIGRHDPKIERALPVIVTRLESAGMIEAESRGSYALTPIGHFCCMVLSEIGSVNDPDPKKTEREKAERAKRDAEERERIGEAERKRKEEERQDRNRLRATTPLAKGTGTRFPS